MMIDHDRVRDLLLQMGADVDDMRGKFPTDRETLYHLRYMHEAGLFKGSVSEDHYDVMSVKIDHLLPVGHDLLRNIRDNGVWHKVKDALLRIGGTASFEIVKKLSLKFAGEALGLTDDVSDIK